MSRGELAKHFFSKGLNCSQAVLMSFADLTGLDEPVLLRIAAPLGGGIGRMREVCGTVSGMMLVLGLVFYNAGNPTGAEKSALYAREQEVARRFRAQTGSIVCRELLAGVSIDSSPNAEERTTQYYKKRPCSELCGIAANILEEYLCEQGVLPTKKQGKEENE